MRVLSNVEFEKLTSSQSYRLQTIARKRCDANPNGFLELDEIPQYVNVCLYSGDRKGATWLKSLIALTKSGELDRIRRGSMTYDDHQRYIKVLHGAGKIPFAPEDRVLCKETGRFGKVIDYLPDDKLYVVVLDPFIVRTYEADKLQKAG